MGSVKKKTYKREVAFSLMTIEVIFLFWSALAATPAHAEHLFDIAKFLMTPATALMAGAFGADWWGKMMIPNKRSE